MTFVQAWIIMWSIAYAMRLVGMVVMSLKRKKTMVLYFHELPILAAITAPLAWGLATAMTVARCVP